jgi:two-component system NtrC family response regulator
MGNKMVAPARVLLIDDDESFRSILEYNLKQAGYEVVSVSNGRKGLKRLEAAPFPVVITDIKMPEMDGLEVLRKVKEQYPETMVIMITAYGSIEMAVEAMREGAYDYITKPLNRDALLMTLEKALQYRHLKEENLRLKQELGERFQADQIVGSSGPMKALVQQLRRVAETDATVLITGETGTGKELVARAIHYHSRRKDDPLVALNCAAIPRDLLESELFGHVKGAFTGAARERKGKFHAANGGTLFLDEIGNMDVSLQAKLLRVLEDQQVTRVGEEKSVKVDVRVLAATNRDLQAAVEAGEFREDLYFRLNVIPLRIPPLREREGDIPLLVQHFVRVFAPGRDVRVDPDVLAAFEAYHWPGNVRELENVIERMLIFETEDVLVPEALPQEIVKGTLKIRLGSEGFVQLPPEGIPLEELEREVVVKALEINGWNQVRAAKFLGVPRHILLYRMEKYRIRPPEGNPAVE